jgi:hypothetical protein
VYLIFSSKCVAMNPSEHTPIEDTIHHAEHRHPVEYFEPEHGPDDGMRRACEVLSRTFMWVADGQSVQMVGVRALVVLYCVRTDLLGVRTLEDISVEGEISMDEIEELVLEFAQTVGWE